MKWHSNNLFEEARIKLTLYYLVIIILVSGLFSLIIYNVVARQIERLARPRPFLPDFISREIVDEQKLKLLITLVWINAGVWIASAWAGYFLAGRTLKPIKQMVEEQNQFISDASHELRTPIATLRAEMEGKLLEKKISDKEARGLINSNLEELDRLQSLTENLLRLTRVHSNSMEKEFTSQIEMAIKIVKPMAEKKKININFRNTGIQGLKIKDETAQILVILLDNAIKYSPEKSTVLVSAEKEGKKLIFSVKDQGMGIDSKDMPFVFDRFYRADKSRSQTFGYGLGLAIAKKLADEIDGKILVESEINKGTKFILSVPV